MNSLRGLRSMRVASALSYCSVTPWAVSGVRYRLTYRPYHPKPVFSDYPSVLFAYGELGYGGGHLP